MKKSALVDALLFTAFSCVNVMAAETVPANSQIYKEAKSLSKVPANSKVFTGKAEVIPMSQQVPGMPVHNGIVIFEPGARTAHSRINAPGNPKLMHQRSLESFLFLC